MFIVLNCPCYPKLFCIQILMWATSSWCCLCGTASPLRRGSPCSFRQPMLSYTLPRLKSKLACHRTSYVCCIYVCVYDVHVLFDWFWLQEWCVFVPFGCVSSPACHGLSPLSVQWTTISTHWTGIYTRLIPSIFSLHTCTCTYNWIVHSSLLPWILFFMYVHIHM